MDEKDWQPTKVEKKHAHEWKKKMLPKLNTLGSTGGTRYMHKKIVSLTRR